MARDAWEELADELVHGSEEEFVAELTERMMALFERACADPDRMAAIASRSREAAIAAWAEWHGRVSEEVEAAFYGALMLEQELLEGSIAAEVGAVDPLLTARGQNEVRQAARGMATIVERQNVALADSLADEWWHATSDAVTRIQMGDDLQSVIRDGARRLAAAGLETIDYKSGVRTTVDAAVRRHAITQQNQCRNDMLVRECHEYGMELVFTSAHYGARPEHAAWQGKPCGLDGPCEVDGVKYPGLAELTGYGTVTGLCGANCRHRMFPYIPGLSKLPDTDFAAFEEKWHMTSDEYYEATQRQRAMERQIRQTKREIALGEAHGADMTEDRYRLGAQQRRLKEHCDRLGLPRDYDREKAYAVADNDGTGISIFRQPRALSPYSRAAQARAAEQQRWRTFPQTRDTVSETHGIRRLGRNEINALQRASDMAFSDMPMSEIEAIRDYTTGLHNDINQRLYGTRKQTRKTRERADAAIVQIDRAMDRFSLDQDVVVFSGTDARHYTSWEVGSIHELGGYLSTSVRYKDAAGFCAREASHGNDALMIVVRVPAETPCLFVGENTFYPEYQGEMILAHGLQYKVVERSEGRMVVEVVADGD